MKRGYIIWGLCCSLWMMVGCNNTPIIEVEESKEAQLDEHILNANKYIANSEETEIEGYVSRRGWGMEILSNGTRLWEYEKGDGRCPVGDDEITISYSVEALTGQKVYDEKMETIELGRNETVPGMESAIRRLSKGSKAKVIIPSAMGYGVIGDGEKIGSRMVMVVNMDIKEIKNK